MWLMIIGVRGVNNAYMLANAEAQRKFKGQQIARGHMNPRAINSFDTRFMKATFTFTNAVPQFKTSNSGPWQFFERKIRIYAKTTCGSQTRQGTL